MYKIIVVSGIFLLGLSAAACGGAEPPVSNNNATPKPTERVCESITDTPAEAYKRLYAAVKEKNTERIKAEVSERSRQFAESLAGRQNKALAEVYANGFTATTFAEKLPEIRDERKSGCWAAVEVRNDKDGRWEDLPFVNEEGSWKLAVGEMFSGSYQSPGKGLDIREKEAANTSRGSVPPGQGPLGNFNANSNAPKYDGPQVEPLNRKK